MSKFRKMTKKELEEILINHRRWLYRDTDGWEAMKATLCNVDLSYMDLSGADLSNAYLSNVDLFHADLCNANLSGTYLSHVTLTQANLSDANLSNAYLDRVWLTHSNLSNANFSGAELYYTKLHDALMHYTNFSCADLRCTDLSCAKNIPYVPMVCPEEGEFIGYKKACGKIVVLSIPADAKRSSATGRKCRCSKAKVLEIDEIGGSISDVMEVSSDHDRNFIYRIGETVYAGNFDDNRFKECAPGIHFFINRKEAENYNNI